MLSIFQRECGRSGGASLRINETLINGPLQSYSIVAPVQERTYRDHYRIATSAIVRPGRAKCTVIFVTAGQTPLRYLDRRSTYENPGENVGPLVGVAR
jgi:hypothetical protein